MSDSGSPGDRVRDERFRALSQVSAVAGLSATLLLLSGCLPGEGSDTASRTSGTGNHPPVVKAASIVPSPLTLSGPLTVRVEAQDLDLNTLSFRYRWLVNGQASAGQTRESLQPELLKRGDKVAVEVVPFDGTIEGTAFRSLLSLSSIRLRSFRTCPLTSTTILRGDSCWLKSMWLIRITIRSPPTYRWRKNESVLKEGVENSLDLAGLTAKDTLQVDVTALDGAPDGTAAVAEQFTMSDSSPTIVSGPAPSPDGDQYGYSSRPTMRMATPSLMGWKWLLPGWPFR